MKVIHLFTGHENSQFIRFQLATGNFLLALVQSVWYQISNSFLTILVGLLADLMFRRQTTATSGSSVSEQTGIQVVQDDQDAASNNFSRVLAVTGCTT